MAQLRDLYYARHVPLTQVAQNFDIPVSTLLRWISELDWPRRSTRPDWVLEERARGGSNPSQGNPPACAQHAQATSPEGRYDPEHGNRSDSPFAGCEDPAAVSRRIAGPRKPLDAERLSYEIAEAARRELAALGDFSGPIDPGLTLDQRERRAKVIGSLSRSIQRIDRVFEARAEKLVLEGRIKQLEAKLRAQRIAPIEDLQAKVEAKVIAEARRLLATSPVPKPAAPRLARPRPDDPAVVEALREKLIARIRSMSD